MGKWGHGYYLSYAVAERQNERIGGDEKETTVVIVVWGGKQQNRPM